MNIFILISIILIIFCILIFIIDIIFSFNRYSYHELFYSYLYNTPILTQHHIINSDNFKDSVKKGIEFIKNKTIVICCLCRNIKDFFEESKFKLEYIGNYFKNYKIILFENDSIDQSRSLLQKWSEQNDNVKLIPCCHIQNNCDCKFNFKSGYQYGALSNSRISKMAFYRNQYIEFMNNNYKDFDYLISYDFDLKGGIFIDGFLKLFDPKIEKIWDGVCASGYQGTSMLYGGKMLYDSLAYVSYYESFDLKKTLYSHLVNMNNKYKHSIEDNLIPIKSGFNGMAIYKIPSIIGIKYKSETRCEHIDFHKQMYEKGKKLYLSPSLVLYTKQQGPPLTINFLIDVFFKKI